MATRREAVLAAVAAATMPFAMQSAASAQGAAATTQATTSLTPSEQLMYAVVRVVDNLQNPRRWGTGFLFNLFQTAESSTPVVITNWHVVDGLTGCGFQFAARSADGTPDLANHLPIEIPNLSNGAIRHPSVDLVAIPVAAAIRDLIAKGHPPFYFGLAPVLIPTDDILQSLDPVEQILTVGFPGSLWDDVHSLPLLHRGYTATAPYIDFKGKKEFLIDIATWPGSSGSPVLLFNDNGWSTRNHSTIVGGTRLGLLGVVYGVGVQDISGNVAIQAGPTQIVAPGQMAVPTNLGACIKASRILEFEPLLVSLGFTPPTGYIMRTNTKSH
jgi:hypothetical protein